MKGVGGSSADACGAAAVGSVRGLQCICSKCLICVVGGVL